MGAVQKLATVVIVGLTALAVLLVLSLADEPNRRNAEAEEQEHVAIERGIDTYITYCLACHGPAGEGTEGGEGWIGKPIGGNTSATPAEPVDRSGNSRGAGELYPPPHPRRPADRLHPAGNDLHHAVLG